MANDPIKLVDVGALDRFKTDIENEIPDSVQYSTMPTASEDWVGKIVQYTGEDASGLGYDLINGHWYKCESWGTGYIWTDLYTDSINNGSKPVISSAVSSALQTKQNIIQVAEMPAASSTRVGDILQYIGTTTASYTNGFFYKCVPGSTSGTYEWTPVSVQSGSPISSTSTTSPITDSADGIVQGLTVYGRSTKTGDTIHGVGEGYGSFKINDFQWSRFQWQAVYFFKSNTTIPNIKTPTDDNTIANISASFYKSETANNVLKPNYDGCISCGVDGHIYLQDNRYDNETDFINNVGDITVIYQQATPTTNTLAIKTDDGTGIADTMATFTTALPLRGVSDTVRDKLTCTADSKQVETVCREVDLSTLTWTMSSTSAARTVFYTTDIEDAYVVTNNANVPRFLCNTKNVAAYGVTWDGNMVSQYIDGKIYITTSSTITNVTGLMEWFTNNPTILVYALATPVTTPLTDAEISAFRGLKTYDSTTNITITDEPDFELDYLKNTNNGKAVANIQRDLQEQIDDLSGSRISMTGYSKPSATSAIVPSDTVNDAIGKLEKGLEDAGGGSSVIDDEHVSTETTYSSSYIEEIFGYFSITWEKATDEEIVQALALADAGKFSPANYWAVGDVRTFSLSAINPTTGVDETQPAQDVEMVIVHLGLYKDENDKTVNAIIHLKNCLTTKGKMNTTNTNSGSWDSCPRRTWGNGNFRDAFSSSIRPIFKQFKTVTAKENNSSELVTSLDYFALPAEKEIFGAKTHSTDAEAAALTQWDYYKTSANRIKNIGTSVGSWFFRSPKANNVTDFCFVISSGAASYYSAISACGIAPFGCI